MKALSLFALAALVAVCCASAVRKGDKPHGDFGDGVTFTIEDDGTLIIDGDGMMLNESVFEGPVITHLGGYLDLITKIIVKKGVKSLGDGVFLGYQQTTEYQHLDIPLIVEGDLKYWGLEPLVFSGIKTMTVEGSVELMSAYGLYTYAPSNEGGFTDLVVRGSFGSLNEECPLNYTVFMATFDLAVVNLGSAALVDEGTFFQHPSLKNFTVGKLNGPIREQAFQKCRELTSVNIGGNVSAIEPLAFSECVNLKDLKLPRTFDRVGEYAFSDCWSLGEVFIPATVKTLGDYAFANCSELSTVYFAGENDFGIDNVFENCSKLEEVLVSDKYKDQQFCGKNVRVVVLPEPPSSSSSSPSTTSVPSAPVSGAVRAYVTIALFLCVLLALF